MSQKLAVPAFFAKPNLGDHDRLRLSAPPGTIIVLNPGISSSQPPNVNDPATQTAWQNLVKGYQVSHPNISVLGYVATANGTLGQGFAEDDIKKYVDQWYKLTSPHIIQPTKPAALPIDGIYFDNGPHAPGGVAIAESIKAFYHAIYAHVQTKPVRYGHPQLGGNNTGPTVLLEASQYMADDGGWIMDDPMATPRRACDIALLWETAAAIYLPEAPRFTANFYPSNPPTWWTDPSNSPHRIAHTIHHTPSDMMTQVVAKSKMRRAGYVYVFDGGGPMQTDAFYPYLAQYWTEEVAAVTSSGSTATNRGSSI